MEAAQVNQRASPQEPVVLPLRFEVQSGDFERRMLAINGLLAPFSVICGTGSWIEAHLITRLGHAQGIPNVKGCGITETEVLDLCRRERDPMLVMLSTSIATDQGLSLCSQLKELRIKPKICIFVEEPTMAIVNSCVQCDAIINVTSFGTGAVRDALVAISEGQHYRDPSLDAAALDDQAILLKPREKQVLDLLALGLTNKDIGLRLNISAVTVRDYVQNLCRKFEALNRTDVVFRASCLGFLPTRTAMP